MIRSDASLRGKVKALAKKDGLRPQEVLQMYYFEHFLLRLEKSPYAHSFVLKGGMLIASIVGIAQRTTMDMDATVTGLPMSRELISEIMNQICQQDVGDEMQYIFERVEPIREDFGFDNWRAHIRVRYGRMDAPIKMDITAGDAIVPRQIEYFYPLMFEDRCVRLMAYPLETVLAEKFLAIIEHGTGTTRARDFYDVYMLLKLRRGSVCREDLHRAILTTAKQRGLLEAAKNWRTVLADVRGFEHLRKHVWPNYTSNVAYAAGVSFDEAVDAVYELASMAGLDS